MDNVKKIAIAYNGSNADDVVLNNICSNAIINIKNKFTSFLGKNSAFLTFKTNVLRSLYKNRGLILRRQNYDLIYREFNNAYFYKNCCKSIVSFYLISKEKDLNCFNFVDLGSGAGSVSIAIKNVLKNSGIITHVDKSSNQLKVASHLLDNKGEFVNLDIADFDSYPNNYILTASYFLCEQEKSSYRKIYEHYNSSEQCKGIVLIDYETVVVELSNHFKSEKPHILKRSIKLSRFLSRVLKENYLTTNCFAVFK